MMLLKHVEKTPIKFESLCGLQKFICEYNLPCEGQWLLVYWAFLVKEHYGGGRCSDPLWGACGHFCGIFCPCLGHLLGIVGTRKTCLSKHVGCLSTLFLDMLQSWVVGSASSESGPENVGYCRNSIDSSVGMENNTRNVPMNNARCSNNKN